jgi:uridine phosphorylase
MRYPPNIAIKMIQFRQTTGNFRDHISVIDLIIARAATPIELYLTQYRAFPRPRIFPSLVPFGMSRIIINFFLLA